jgi:hypothetical protein
VGSKESGGSNISEHVSRVTEWRSGDRSICEHRQKISLGLEEADMYHSRQKK